MNKTATVELINWYNENKRYAALIRRPTRPHSKVYAWITKSSYARLQKVLEKYNFKKYVTENEHVFLFEWPNVDYIMRLEKSILDLAHIPISDYILAVENDELSDDDSWCGKEESYDSNNWVACDILDRLGIDSEAYMETVRQDLKQSQFEDEDDE